MSACKRSKRQLGFFCCSAQATSLKQPPLCSVPVLLPTHHPHHAIVSAVILCFSSLFTPILLVHLVGVITARALKTWRCLMLERHVKHGCAGWSRHALSSRKALLFSSLCTLGIVFSAFISFCPLLTLLFCFARGKSDFYVK